MEIESCGAVEPGAGEVLLRMEACGLCHSDLFVCGLPKLPLAPLRLGHEGIGRVEAVGAGVDGLAAGRSRGHHVSGHTAGLANGAGPGGSGSVRSRLTSGTRCRARWDGYVVAPAAGLVRVPDGLLAASIAAPLCCAGWTAFGALREAASGAGADGGARSDSAGWDTWRCRWRCIRGCGWRWWTRRRKKMAAAGAGSRSGEVRRLAMCDAAIVFTGSSAAIPQAFRSLRRNGHAGAGGAVGGELRTAAGGHGIEGHCNSRELSGDARGSGRACSQLAARGRAAAARAHACDRGDARTAGAMRAAQIAGPGRDRSSVKILLMAEVNVYPPSPEFVQQANVKGMEGYRALYQRAAEQPGGILGRAGGTGAVLVPEMVRTCSSGIRRSRSGSWAARSTPRTTASTGT